MASFGEALKAYRKLNRLTLDQLGDALELSKGYLSMIENDKCSAPSPVFIKEVTQGFNDDYITLMVAAGYLPEGCSFPKGSEVMPKKRTDLIGQTGTRTTQIEVIDAKEYETGVSVQVSDNTGEVYWTDLENIDLD